MISESSVRKAVKEIIEGTGLFVVDIAVKNGDKVFVELDKDPAVSISELAKVNRFLENYFEGETDDVEMRVSSPGLDRPLRHTKQFEKYKGHEVKVVLNDGQAVEGEMESYDKEKLALIIKTKKKGRKELEKSRVEFKIEEINKTLLIVKIK